MNVIEMRTTSRCLKLQELPPIVNEWQQKTWQPDCDHYDCGECDNPQRRDGDSTCPFDGKALPFREVSACKQLKHQRVPVGPENAIMRQIVQRTGTRIQMLDVEIVDDTVIIRGHALCHHVKQLALQAVLEVLGSSCTRRVELNVEVSEPTMSLVNSQ